MPVREWLGLSEGEKVEGTRELFDKWSGVGPS